MHPRGGARTVLDTAPVGLEHHLGLLTGGIRHHLAIETGQLLERRERSLERRPHFLICTHDS